MQDLSLHILDIAENAIRAGADRITIAIREDDERDRLTVSIEDNGKGMDAEMAARATDAFFTTKSGKRFGLGLPLLAQAAEQAEGRFELDSEEGKGTKITAEFRLSHPDAKPLGDIVETMRTLIAANADIQFILDYETGKEHYYFDSAQ